VVAAKVAAVAAAVAAVAKILVETTLRRVTILTILQHRRLLLFLRQKPDRTPMRLRLT
jgi:hypothetical protein